jgi:hypothetical protein
VRRIESARFQQTQTAAFALPSPQARPSIPMRSRLSFACRITKSGER